jgi:hypothetical protein
MRKFMEKELESRVRRLMKYNRNLKKQGKGDVMDMDAKELQSYIMAEESRDDESRRVMDLYITSSGSFLEGLFHFFDMETFNNLGDDMESAVEKGHFDSFCSQITNLGAGHYLNHPVWNGIASFGSVVMKNQSLNSRKSALGTGRDHSRRHDYDDDIGDSDSSYAHHGRGRTRSRHGRRRGRHRRSRSRSRHGHRRRRRHRRSHHRHRRSHHRRYSDIGSSDVSSENSSENDSENGQDDDNDGGSNGDKRSSNNEQQPHQYSTDDDNGADVSTPHVKNPRVKNADVKKPKLNNKHVPATNTSVPVMHDSVESTYKPSVKNVPFDFETPGMDPAKLQSVLKSCEGFAGSMSRYVKTKSETEKMQNQCDEGAAIPDLISM